MKKKLLFLLFTVLITSVGISQEKTLTIGTSTSSSATRGPFQRSDSGSNSVFSRGNLVYTAAELSNLTSTSTITKINFDLGSTNIIDATGNAILNIYMKNSSVTEATTIADWDVAIAGYTLVGTYTFNTTNNFPGVEGFLSFDLDTDFDYSGNTLEVAIDWDCSGLTSTNADANLLLTGNGSLNWHWTATAHNSLTYSASSSAPTSTGNLKAQRANTQFVYTDPNAADELIIGTSTSSSATRGPFQRSSSPSTSTISRGNLVYTAAELTSLGSGGLGALISAIDFDLGSTNIIDATGNAILNIYMKNSSVTEATTIPDWDAALAGYTLVGTYTFNTTNNFPGAEGFLSFDLSSEFEYTGGTLEVAIDWNCSGLTSTNADANLLFTDNGSLNWHWTATAHNSLTYSASSSAPTSTGNLKSERANTKFTFRSLRTSTWDGSIDNDWDTTANWSDEIIPTELATVIIPSGLTNYPTISSAATAKSINIASGASLIANTSVTSDVTYNRNLPTTNWYLVSSPVGGETIEDIIANHTLATGTSPNIGIAPYLVASATWDYQAASSTGTLNSGQGYSVKMAASGDMSFTGTINTSNVSSAIINGANSFNLIGNPFTSYVNSDTFATANTGFLSEETIWLWDGSQYVTYNAANPIEIAPGQGFFVLASASNNVTFNTSNQSHQSDTFMRQSPNSNFELFVKNGDNKKSTKVFYIDNATTSFDNSYDSSIFSGVESDFNVFTELITENEGKRLAIQSIPSDNTLTIPVGITAKAGDELTFSSESYSLPNDVTIYLEDKNNNEYINLSEGEYKVVLNEDNNGIGTYYIHTQAKSLSTIDNDISNVSVYKSNNKELTIAGLNTNGDITITSLLGKRVLETSIDSNGVSKINLPSYLSSGIYIVNLNTDLGKITKKIILE